MSEAFVYCWTDHKNNKLYIGSHKGEICDGYICSSKYMLAEYKNAVKDAWVKRKQKKKFQELGGFTDAGK